MSSARGRHCATTLANGKILISGGEVGNNAIAEAMIYDPDSNTWSSAGVLHARRFWHTATLLTSGQVLVTGGLYVNGNDPVYIADAELYDASSNSWTSVGAMQIGRLMHTATLLPNGKVLVVGGDTASGATATTEIFDPATNSWSYAQSVPAARFSHTATLLSSGRVLVTGGHDSGVDYSASYLSDAQLYDPDGDNWSAAGVLTTARGLHTAALLENGSVLVAGGMDNSASALSSSELYNPVNNSWSSAGSLGIARHSHRTILLPDGKVLVVGGDATSGSAVFSSAEIYDPASNNWSSGGGLPITWRDGHTLSLLSNGMAFIVGGHEGGLVLASTGLGRSAAASRSAGGNLVNGHEYATTTLLPDGKVLLAGGFGLVSPEIYDPQVNTWSKSIGGPISKLQSSTLLTNGKVLVTGAGTSSLYDTAAHSWTAAGLPSTPRIFHSATLLENGDVLVIGGYDPNSSAGSFASTERYSPLANQWSNADSMAVSREGHSATLLSNGNVLVVGGDNGSVLSSAEIYDASDDTWHAANNPIGRAAHTATLLPSGLVLVVGGYSNTAHALTTCQLYDPTTNTWTGTGSLNIGRSGHSATLLLDGTVLVSGGFGLTGALDSAELYNPISKTWMPFGNLTTPRADQSAVMLADGRVLIAGGDNATALGGLASVEIFDPGLVPVPARQPLLSSVPSLLTDKFGILLTGIGFRPNIEASGGDTAGSASNHPVMQVMRLDNGQIRWLAADPAHPFSSTEFTSTATSLMDFPDGHVRVTTFVDGIPSSSLITLFDPDEEIFRDGFE